MTDEELDHANHLIKATRKAREIGMTKEQFLQAAASFWDSWQLAKEFMDGKK